MKETMMRHTPLATVGLALLMAGCAGLDLPLDSPAERLVGPKGLVSEPTKATAAATFVVSTAAGSTRGHEDGSGLSAKLKAPYGVAIDGKGAFYVADAWNHAIRKVTLDAQGMATVSTVAGRPDAAGGYADGGPSQARFDFPTGVAVDAEGALYVADYNNHRIRKITVGTDGEATVTSFAGSGTSGDADAQGAAAAFTYPRAVAVDGAGTVYVAEPQANRIRKVSREGAVTTLAGAAGEGFADGPAASARFNRPSALAVDAGGTVYVADTWNHRIRKITPDGTVSTLAGGEASGTADGSGRDARFRLPEGIFVDAKGQIWVSDTGNERIRRIAADGTVVTVAGSLGGYADGPGAGALFRKPNGLAADGTGRVLVGDLDNHRLRLIVPATP